jgi:hypothetical protein
MNAQGSFYSVVGVNQPKKIITINTEQTKYLMSVPQESNTGGKINGNICIHSLAPAAHGSWIQVDPSARLLVD